MTLIELLVVVSLMALLAAAVAVGAMRHIGPATESTAETDARSIRAAAQAYLLERGACPADAAELFDEGYLDRASRRVDPWDGEFELTCEGGEIEVASAGPDRTWGTEDDLRVPDDALTGRGGY